jgi:hypothetical protein
MSERDGALSQMIAAIEAIEAPSERALAAQQFILGAELAVRQARQIRDESIVAMRVAGWSQRRVAAHLGLSPALIVVMDRTYGVVTERTTRAGASRSA